MKKRMTILTTCVCVCSLIAAFSYAYEIISVDGTIKTQGADVFVSVKADEENIYPGEKVRYEPLIDYRGVDSYIRLKLDTNSSMLTDKTFSGLDEKWIKRGDYYYYKDVVTDGEKIHTFNSFTVPEEYQAKDISNISGTKLRVSLLCDAIQADSFSPDFDSDNPWGNLNIVESNYSGKDYVKEDVSKNASMKITFSGVGKYTVSSESIFTEYLKPGDICKGKIELKNEGKERVKLDFFESTEEKNDEKNLSDVITLKIKIDDEIFFDGKLNSKNLLKKQNLCTVDPGEEKTFSYEFYLPKQTDNKYDMGESMFTWNFQSEGDSLAADTGDRNKMMFFTALFGSSFALLILIKRKKDRDDDM